MDEGIMDLVCARYFEVELFVLLYIQTVTPNYIHTCVRYHSPHLIAYDKQKCTMHYAPDAVSAGKRVTNSIPHFDKVP